MSVKIYVEGGGNQERTIKACRAGFSKYFERIAQEGKRPRIVVCGSRDQAYRDFAQGLSDPKYQVILLLVDSEQSVEPGDSAWIHLNKVSRWQRPTGALEDSAHLMVQIMESWFMADKNCLEQFYGQHFNGNALPQRAEIELISKQDVINGLENATSNTKKGRYHKTQHGFEILSMLDPAKIEAASQFARHLHRRVREEA